MSAAKPAVAPVILTRYQQNQHSQDHDLVVVEEPLEIRLGYGPATARQQKNISVTMRTPGHDFDLAIGFLYSEGIIQTPEEVLSVNYCRNVEKPEEEFNTVRVELNPAMQVDLSRLERHFYTSSSCGVCGKTSLEAVKALCPAPASLAYGSVKPGTIYKMAEALLGQQTVFNRTGGLHAAALFDLEANLIAVREDVGRHNAVDKLIGGLFMQGRLPLEKYLLQVSGRAGFELVQKAVMAGIPLMAAVGAPSSLAISLAGDANMTLIGFAREGRFNVYTAPLRLA